MVDSFPDFVKECVKVPREKRGEIWTKSFPLKWTLIMWNPVFLDVS